MTINREEVDRIARLAHLRLEPAEIDDLTRDLGKILGYIAALGTAETEITSTSSDSPAPCHDPAPREDARVPSMSPEEALFNAPESEGGLFKVPKVLP